MSNEYESDDEAVARRRRARAFLAATVALTGVGPSVPHRAPCTHRYGIAGGFSECTTCGIRTKRGGRR